MKSNIYDSLIKFYYIFVGTLSLCIQDGPDDRCSSFCIALVTLPDCTVYRVNQKRYCFRSKTNVSPYLLAAITVCDFYTYAGRWCF